MVTNNAMDSSSPLVQIVYASKSAYQLLSTVMNAGDVIPTNVAGDEILTLAITPKRTTNILVIEFSTMLQQKNNSDSSEFALFQDATANALSATRGVGASSSDVAICYLRHIMVAGTTAATTFKIRGGPEAAGNAIAVNGDINALARRFGGVAATFLTIKEYFA